jgi:hypothetical protein
MKKKVVSAIISVSALSVALAVPAAAQGASTDPTASPLALGEHTVTLTSGEQRPFYIPEAVDLTQPFTLATTDGGLEQVVAASVDGARTASGGSTSKFGARGAAPSLSTWHTWDAPGDGK